ncbi:MAG: hypothetical protein ACR2KZ_08055, partial [Segetibacter sp.]
MKKSASYFEPAVSRASSGLVKEKGPKQKKRLFLYGRPDVHRNLFFTALDAIDFAFKAGFLDKDNWELFMAGQDKIPDIQLSSGVVIKNRGKMAMEDYVSFSKTIDVAVSPMMAPHPNYPTLEFASIGTAVVTTKYANKTDLSSYSKNIISSDISVESIAGAIKKASIMPTEQRQKNSQNSAIASDWRKTLEKPLEEVFASINTLS